MSGRSCQLSARVLSVQKQEQTYFDHDTLGFHPQTLVKEFPYFLEVVLEATRDQLPFCESRIVRSERGEDGAEDFSSMSEWSAQ